jgi:hypothetical protein
MKQWRSIYQRARPQRQSIRQSRRTTAKHPPEQKNSNKASAKLRVSGKQPDHDNKASVREKNDSKASTQR